MADDKKKGIFSKLFGSKKSSCCNLKIEEIADEQAKPEDTSKPSGGSSCCQSCCGDTSKRSTQE